MQLQERINSLEKKLGTIEKDIYLESEYDFEINCPYCNFNFIIDPDEAEDEVQCPECKNVIEIDWDGTSCMEDGCGCNCDFDCDCDCSHGCTCDEDEQDENDDDM